MNLRESVQLFTTENMPPACTLLHPSEASARSRYPISSAVIGYFIMRRSAKNMPVQ